MRNALVHTFPDVVEMKPMRTVTVYGAADCGACVRTKQVLLRKGIEFADVDIDAHPDLRETLKAWGFTSLPVVRAGEEWWCGLRPDKLIGLPNPQSAAVG